MHSQKTHAGVFQAAPWIIALALFSVGQDSLSAAQSLLAGIVPDRIARLQQKALLEAAATMDLACFEQSDTYDLLQRARDATGVRMTNLLALLTVVGRQIVTLVAYTGLLWAAHPALAVVVALPAIPSSWLKVRAARSGVRHDYGALPARRLKSYLLSILLGRSSNQEVRLFGLFGHLLDRWREAHTRARAAVVARSWTEARTAIATTSVQIAAYAAAIGILAGLIAKGGLKLGDYVVLTGAAAAFQVNLENVLHRGQDLLRDLPLLHDFQRFIDLSQTAKAQAGTKPFPRPLQAGLIVRGLRFRYPSGTKDVLQDISFQAAPGEIVAIVGPNGAGKSSLAKLLLGLYRPCSGVIAYDGVNVGAIAPAEIAHHCAAVFQDFARFRRPVREEIAANADGLAGNDAALWESLAAVGLAERIRRLPRQLDTFLDPSLGEGNGGGSELSGGEWQKVALARAVARSAQVLILDEPTAALDPQAEVDAYQRFVELSRGRMTFLISHRIGSARLAHRILVLDEGRLIEQGSHSELLARGGLYSRLFESQARWYRSAAEAVHE